MVQQEKPRKGATRGPMQRLAGQAKARLDDLNATGAYSSALKNARYT